LGTLRFELGDKGSSQGQFPVKGTFYGTKFDSSRPDFDFLTKFTPTRNQACSECRPAALLDNTALASGSSVEGNGGGASPRVIWSPTLEVREQHKIVSAGLYRHIRHPMYAAIWLRVSSKSLFLPNWVAGLAGIVSFAPMYFLQVPREERMMTEALGEPYVEYMLRTGRIFPQLRSRGTAGTTAKG